MDVLLKDGWDAGRFAVFYDPFQIPFRTGASRMIAGFTRSTPARCKLTVNCRNTQEIAWATEALSEIYTSESARTNGPPPQWLWTKNDADTRTQISTCLRGWLDQGISPTDIVVLSPIPWTGSVANGLNSPLPVRPWMGEEKVLPKTVRFVSIGEFKGMEAKAVILCDADNWDDEQISVLFYVALSRPTSLLAVALDANLKEEWVKRFSAQGIRWKNMR